MNQADTPVIEINGLTKTYKETQALKDLSLRVKQNSIFAFLGPNGAGKTTTIKLLLGLIRPTSGSARIFGLDIGHDSVAIRSRIGYLPQEPRYYEYMSAREILRYTAKFFFKGPKTEIEKRVSETLELVGLADKADRPIRGFSGGERQRLGIGQAQVNYPNLLILDEPAASLDPMGRHDVLEVMERLRKHTTIFYCTHILDDVQRVSDTVAILNQGRLVAFGPIEELRSGGEGIIYTITIKGKADGTLERVKSLPWVSDIQVRTHNESSIWTVSVNDEGAAEMQLMRQVLADDQLAVTDFRRREFELEDIFMKIIEGGTDDNGK